MGANYFKEGAENSWNYLQKSRDCLECMVCPKYFEGILKLKPGVILEYLKRFFKRGY
jgi:hypothetical protein